MKIATYNVNGINGRRPQLLDWLRETQPDIVCLQEIKTDDTKFPHKHASGEPVVSGALAPRLGGAGGLKKVRPSGRRRRAHERSTGIACHSSYDGRQDHGA